MLAEVYGDMRAGERGRGRRGRVGAQLREGTMPWGWSDVEEELQKNCTPSV